MANQTSVSEKAVSVFVNGRPYIAVVGGANIDVGGRSFAPLRTGDSNPGEIRSALGGVGRNIAHNLALLGAEVKLVTALGGDDGARRIESSCRALGIDLSAALRFPDAATGTYLFIGGPDGDMALAMNDMAVFERMTPAALTPVLPLLNTAALVVIDANLPAESIAFLAENCTAPLYGDTVSAAKAGKFAPVLGRFHTLKPNRMEAEKLSGIPITDQNSLFAAADALLDTGLQRVFISLGADGVLAAEGDKKILLNNPPVQLVNATGCGDAFMAALAYAALENADLPTAARLGLAAAAVAAESAETINPALCGERIKARLETF